MTTIPFGHQVISASAGSGKTFQLANRYIALLAGGVDPSRIVALTFSRKAAGEILDKIIGRLAQCAGSDEETAALREHLAQAGYGAAAVGLTRPAVLGLLRQLLQRLHLARIGTLDSFFVSVLQAFPFEFGLGGAFDIIDGPALAEARRRVLTHVLRHSRNGPGELLEQFKKATFGQETKTFGATLTEFVESFHATLLEAPDEAQWGNAARIWPAGFPWPILQDEREAHAAALRQAARAAGFKEKQTARFADFADEAEAFDAWSMLPARGPLVYMLERALPVLDDLERGGVHMTVDSRTPLELPADVCRPLAALVRHVVGCLLAVRLQRTQGIYALLRAYESGYQRQVREAGRLGFHDIQFLLGAGERGDGPRLSGLADSEAGLYIDYRLDGAFDHWMLDEFQDTSTVQWMALRNLADEVLQCRDGSRTLFYVGDVKQAIYGWRGGDYELFHRILESYNRDEEVLEERRLALSWRSSPVIMDAVNAVFDDLDTPALPGPILSRWHRAWTRHAAARAELPGHAALLEVARCRPAAAQEAAKMDAVVGLLGQLRPWERGLTAAVLVRKNAAGRAVEVALRQAGIPASLEGTWPVVDNVVCAALLSLLKLAAHPGDTRALHHVAMTPLRDLLWPDKPPSARVGLAVLEEVEHHGVEHFVSGWRRRLDDAGLLTDFARERLAQLGLAAAEFDLTGEHSVDAFLDLARDYQVADAAASTGIQVMTMHKSKGLEFDLVVLPDLESHTGIATAGHSGLAVAHKEGVDRRPEWVLDMPPKLVAQGDAELSRYLETQAVARGYEELCGLYVAMTRARHALYMIVPEPPKSGSAFYLSTLLRERLGDAAPEPIALGEAGANVLWELGDKEAPLRLEAKGEGLKPPAGGQRHDVPRGGTAAPPAPTRQRLQRLQPSGADREEQDAGMLFGTGRLNSAALGTAVHALFEAVEWAEDADPDAVAAAWRAQAQALVPAAADKAEAQFRQAMAMPAVRKALSRPAPTAGVWRERNFEAIIEGQWVSGCFDRVVLTHAGDGRVDSAVIQDFKTNRITTEHPIEKHREHYRPQMALYGRVLARMLDLAESRIRKELIFTRTGQVVPIP